MILNNKSNIAIRVSAVLNIRRLVYGPDAIYPRYYIELRYKHATDSDEYTYGSDKDARDKDFERINRAMDTLDGIQQ